MFLKSLLIKDTSKKKKFWKKERSLDELIKGRFEKTIKVSLFDRLMKFSKKTQRFETYSFFLVGPYFGYHNPGSLEVRYLDLTLCIMGQMKSDSSSSSKGLFLVRHSSEKKEFFSNDQAKLEQWYQKLRRFCIQTDFSAHYDLGAPLGKGNFSVVYQARSKKDGKIYAAKTLSAEGLKKSSKVRQAARIELSIHRSLNHPYILQFIEAYEDENNVYFITELLEGGELFENVLKRKRYPEKEAAIVMKQLFEALVYLEQKGIIHRDIKLENVLLVNKEESCLIKLADFGLSITNQKLDPQFRCGTPGYVAPEIILGKPYDCKVDIFSAGVILYILLSGCTPFPGKTYDEILARNKKCSPKFRSKYWTDISFEAIDFVISLMSLDPAKRPTAAEALESTWMRNILQEFEPTSQVGLDTLRVKPVESMKKKSEDYIIKEKNQDTMETKEGQTSEDHHLKSPPESPMRTKNPLFLKNYSLNLQNERHSFTKNMTKRHSMVSEDSSSMHKKIIQRNLLKQLETLEINNVDEVSESLEQTIPNNYSSRFDIKSGLQLNSFYGKGVSQRLSTETDVPSPRKADQEASVKRSGFGKMYSSKSGFGTLINQINQESPAHGYTYDEDNVPDEENILKNMMGTLKTMCFSAKPSFEQYDTGDNHLNLLAICHFPKFKNIFLESANENRTSFL